MNTVEYSFVSEQIALPQHLGGHENETHVDEGALQFLIEEFGIKSAVDVGCGPGGMVELMMRKNIDVLGVDGDNVVSRPDNVKSNIVIHDYTTGPFEIKKDLAWSVEFVEHVEKKFMPNFLATFKGCKFVAMTHALPNQPGHHHVNCMPDVYWFGVMEAVGFELLIDGTNKMREKSTMKERYIRQQGYLFKNLNVA